MKWYRQVYNDVCSEYTVQVITSLPTFWFKYWQVVVEVGTTWKQILYSCINWRKNEKYIYKLMKYVYRIIKEEMKELLSFYTLLWCWSHALFVASWSFRRDNCSGSLTSHSQSLSANTVSPFISIHINYTYVFLHWHNPVLFRNGNRLLIQSILFFFIPCSRTLVLP